MKKIRLRKWVKVVLTILAFMSFIIASCDCDNTRLFIIKSIISLITFVFSTMTLLIFQDDKEL